MMDIEINDLTLEYLEDNVNGFIDILKNEKHEYWKKAHFLKDVEGKYALSIYAVQETSLVGYVIATQKVDSAHINKFMVRDEFRGRRIGERLAIHFEKKIKAMRRFKDISLTVQIDNVKAIKFYERLNFFPAGFRMSTVDNTQLIIMKKTI